MNIHMNIHINMYICMYMYVCIYIYMYTALAHMTYPYAMRHCDIHKTLYKYLYLMYIYI